MQHVWMAANGCLVIPASIRAEVGMERGGAFVVSVHNGKVVLEPYSAVLARVRAEVREHIPPGGDLVGELIGDRRADAQNE